MACIYKIQHKESGKVYIGQTKKTLDWRLNNNWCGHFALAFKRNSTCYIHCALRKYGKEAFTYEVLEEQSNNDFKDASMMKEWLNEREIYWVSEYNSNCHDFGYNKTKGGSFDYSTANHDKHSKRMTEYNNKCWSDEKFREKRSALVSAQFKKQWQKEEYRDRVISKMKQTISTKSKEEKHEIAMKQVETKRKTGSIYHTEASKEKLRLASMNNTNVKGRIYVHKESKSRLIRKEELDKFLSEGFILGRGKVQWRQHED